MTLDEIRIRVWSRLDEDSDDALRYSQADVDEAINDGIQHFCVRTGCLRASTTITQTANQLFHDLPSDLVFIARIKSDTTNDPLVPTSARQLDAGSRRSNRDWERRLGTSADFYLPFGMDEVGLYPLSSSGTETYTLHYAQDPGTSNVSADADEPSIPLEYHEALVEYAVSRLLMTESKIDEAKEAMEMYLEAVVSAKAKRTNLDSEYTHGPRSSRESRSVGTVRV